MKFKWFGILFLGLLVGCPENPPAQTQYPTIVTQTVTTTITTSTPAPAPIASNDGIAIAMVLDTSGSMDGERLQAVKKIWNEKMTPKLNLYQKTYSNLEIALVRCGESPRILSGMQTFNADTVGTIINDTSASGGTPLGEALLNAYQEVAKSSKIKKHIFILTDGEANGDYSPRTVLEAFAQAYDLNTAVEERRHALAALVVANEEIRRLKAELAQTTR